MTRLLKTLFLAAVLGCASVVSFAAGQLPINAYTFGVKADGATDDTVALQKAFDTGLPLQLPCGTIVTTATINLTIVANQGHQIFGCGSLSKIGTGTSKTIIKPSSAVSTAFFIDGTSIASVQGFRLRDFAIDMTNMTDASTRTGILQGRAYAGEYSNIQVVNDGTSKRAMKFTAGALQTTIDNVRGRIIELSGTSLGDAVTTLQFKNVWLYAGYVMNNAAGINVWGGVVDGSSDKFDLTNIAGLTITGVDIEGTGNYLNVHAGVTNVRSFANTWGGFSGTYKTGSAITGKNISLDDYDFLTGDGALTYREQSWTPVLNINAVTTGITYSGQGASCTRVGNRTACAVDIILSSKGAQVGAVTITGLPWAANAGFTQEFAFGNSNSSFTGTMYGRIAPSASTIQLIINNAGAAAAAADTNLTNTSILRSTFTYLN